MGLDYGFYATHPGEVLKDELEARGISQRKFAESIGMAYSVLNELLKAQRKISGDKLFLLLLHHGTV